MADDVWRRCSACKGPIALGAPYYVCSVSTCNRKRTALAFCTVSCWEVHLPIARHREAWAVEETAPRTPQATAPVRASAAGRAAPSARPAPPARPEKRRITPASSPSAPRAEREAPDEILIIASRLKGYIRARSGFSTSDRVLEPLSRIVRSVADQAIQKARRDERRTVLERDVTDPRSR